MREEEIPITLRLNKEVALVGRLIAKHYDEDFDKFISEEVSKILFSISESSSTILGPSMSDELKQQTQKVKLLEQRLDRKRREKKKIRRRRGCDE